MALNIRQLRYFVAVAEELHFTRAAERLGMAQPPLSQQIKQLENDLNAVLFRRTRRSVQLTREGQMLLERARPLLAGVQDIEDLMQRAGRGEAGLLRVGYVASACFETIPAVVRAFRHRYPDIQLQLNELGSGPQVEQLLSNQIDVGLLRPPTYTDELTFSPLFEEQMLILLPDTHRLAKRKRVRVADLADEPFIIHQRKLGIGLYDKIVALCQSAGFSPNVVQETGSSGTVLSLVAAEMGVGMVAASAAFLDRPGIVARPIPSTEALLEVGLSWRATDESPIVERFCELAGEVIGAGQARR
ncbi:MAG: LysR family transcriptional regulator [Nocardioides sp.]